MWKKAHDRLYKYLKMKKSGFFGSRIKQNFTKFHIRRDGEVVKHYAPSVIPEQMKEDVKKILNNE